MSKLEVDVAHIMEEFVGVAAVTVRHFLLPVHHTTLSVMGLFQLRNLRLSRR